MAQRSFGGSWKHSIYHWLHLQFWGSPFYQCHHRKSPHFTSKSQPQPPARQGLVTQGGCSSRASQQHGRDGRSNFAAAALPGLALGWGYSKSCGDFPSGWNLDNLWESLINYHLKKLCNMWEQHICFCGPSANPYNMETSWLEWFFEPSNNHAGNPCHHLPVILPGLGRCGPPLQWSRHSHHGHGLQLDPGMRLPNGSKLKNEDCRKFMVS